MALSSTTKTNHQPFRLTSKYAVFALIAMFFTFDWQKIGIQGKIGFPKMPNKKEVVKMSFLALLALLELTSTKTAFLFVCVRLSFKLPILPNFLKKWRPCNVKTTIPDRQFDWFRTTPAREKLHASQISKQNNADEASLSEIKMAA